MGSSHIFKCNKCGYEKESSGALDWGFRAVVEPHICNDCNELTDVIVGDSNYGPDTVDMFDLPQKEYIKKKKLDKDNLPDELENKEDFYKCWECGSKNLTVWDTRKKPCPKCGGRMKNTHTIVTMWD